MKGSPDWVRAALLGSAGFLGSYVFASIAFGPALAISALCFVSGTLLFSGKKESPETASGGIRKADVEAALQEGARKLELIRSSGKLLQSPTRGSELQGRVHSICQTITKILQEIKRDPDDLKRARQFLSYYLDSTISILDKYRTLSSQDIRDPAIAASLERAEKMLDTLNAAFEKQLAHLLTNDVMNLDSELSLLEKTIDMEGLGES